MMSSLVDFAREVDDVLRPWEDFEVLLLYGVVSKYLGNFLGDREIASKIWLSDDNFFIRRGSKEKPLLVDMLEKNVSIDLLKKRNEFSGLKEAREELSDVEELIWKYFVSGKLANFFYATNGESKRCLSRAYLDIDRGENVSAEEARELTAELSELIHSSSGFMSDVEETFVHWTGNSFHYYFFFKEKKNLSFYDEAIKKDAEKGSVVQEWVDKLDDEFDGLNIVLGHSRKNKTITIDPSQTPVGKLGRVPLGSLHLKNSSTVDGVSIPLEEDMLFDSDLISKLNNYGPIDVLFDAPKLAERLPNV